MDLVSYSDVNGMRRTLNSIYEPTMRIRVSAVSTFLRLSSVAVILESRRVSHLVANCIVRRADGSTLASPVSLGIYHAHHEGMCVTSRMVKSQSQSG